MIRRQHAVGREDQRLLAGMRAGGEPDRAPGQHLAQPPQFRLVGRQRRRGQLQIARLADPAQPRARSLSASVALRGWTRANPPST